MSWRMNFILPIVHLESRRKLFLHYSLVEMRNIDCNCYRLPVVSMLWQGTWPDIYFKHMSGFNYNDISSGPISGKTSQVELQTGMINTLLLGNVSLPEFISSPPKLWNIFTTFLRLKISFWRITLSDVFVTVAFCVWLKVLKWPNLFSHVVSLMLAFFMRICILDLTVLVLLCGHAVDRTVLQVVFIMTNLSPLYFTIWALLYFESFIEQTNRYIYLN